MLKKINKKSIIDNLLLFIICAFLPCLLIVFCAPFYNGINFSDTKNILFSSITYLLIFIILLLSMYYKNNKKINKALVIFGVCLLLNFIFRFINMDIKSNDYRVFLEGWVEKYRNLSLKECFSTKVGNYAPPYNYFLILFSRINLSDLYLIKFLSFIFEILTAYYITKLISYISKKEFNILIFLAVLCVPVFLINSCEWGQCDSIYTFFSFMAIYFAIKHNSKLSFVFFGLSLSFKLQAILLFPVALVLLLCKDSEGRKILKWKDIWLAPLSYVLITCISMFFGKSFNDAFLIYFEQSTSYSRLSSSCPNLASFFNIFDEFNIVKYSIMFALIIISILVLAYVLIRYIKKKTITDYDIVNLSFLVTFLVVLLMPKMLDRYFYLSNLFAIVLLFVSKNDLYKKMLFITLVTSSIAHSGLTPYFYVSSVSLMVYSVDDAFYLASISNCICGVMFYLNRDELN